MINVLNLYAGIGGNRYLWRNCNVTAVEINEDVAAIYKQYNPNDEIIITDAHDYLIHTDLQQYDFIWSSPPCQTHTRMQWGQNRTHTYADMSLYQEIIFLRTFYKGKWVVENVRPYYDYLVQPTQTVGRHVFWSNFWFHADDIKQPKNFIKNLKKDELLAWLGLPDIETIGAYINTHDPYQCFRNAVHPTLSAQIFNYIQPKEHRKQLHLDI